jgi:hypothetical protein
MFWSIGLIIVPQTIKYISLTETMRLLDTGHTKLPKKVALHSIIKRTGEVDQRYMVCWADINTILVQLEDLDATEISDVLDCFYMQTFDAIAQVVAYRARQKEIEAQVFPFTSVPLWTFGAGGDYISVMECVVYQNAWAKGKLTEELPKFISQISLEEAWDANMLMVTVDTERLHSALAQYGIDELSAIQITSNCYIPGQFMESLFEIHLNRIAEFGQGG